MMPERANVTLNVGGDDLGIPFLTRSMLDLWVHALHGSNPFLIVGRTDDDRRFIQTYRNAPAAFTLQYRDGAEADVMSTEVDAPGAVADLIWDWVHDDRTRLDRLAWENAF
ncbi:hypothetical protein KZZ52_18755 [Dactylosporangium sp. AC04546]|uniref:hypothetical protein n=1 Tax=Dactylosporangium sp. AC04546 TaxID=2862460 RepID=UPI001EDCE9D2|nr:hypothetical protein [Dactylosporangium sp. AC04546]WVK87344.1 hypothetical protein KZZ52_18755 [Dactylosporangium sp. AC04546]